MKTCETKIKHTPGPWELHSLNEIVHEVTPGLVEAVPIYTNRIAGTLTPVADDFYTAEANNALIVHAVNCHAELLEAVKTFHKILVNLAEGTVINIGDEQLDGEQFCENIVNLIAKAEGSK